MPMSVDDYLEDLDRYAHAVDEVHSVGGLHPEWGVEHYESLFQHAATPSACIHQGSDRR